MTTATPHGRPDPEYSPRRSARFPRRGRRRPARTATLTCTVLSGLALAGCATTTSGPPITDTSPPPAAATTAGVGLGGSGAAAAPCTLLTQSDAEAAAGQPLTPGTQNAPLGMCTYTSADFTAGVALTVGDWGSIQAAARAGTTPPTPVPGIGDQALALTSSNGSLLYVRKADRGFLITLNGPRIDPLPDHGLAHEKALAATVAQRL